MEHESWPPPAAVGETPAPPRKKKGQPIQLGLAIVLWGFLAFVGLFFLYANSLNRAVRINNINKAAVRNARISEQIDPGWGARHKPWRPLKVSPYDRAVLKGARAIGLGGK
jgi:hypothetical protein